MQSFFRHVNNYIEGAAREGNEEYVKIFEEIKTDAERHAKTLRELVEPKRD
jgi:rubrerythrin